MENRAMKTTEEWTIDASTVKLLNLGKGLVGHVIRCVSGTLWVTQEGDSRDHFLAAGEEFVIEAPGVVVVQALAPATGRFGPSPFSQEKLEQYLFDRNGRAA
jgi:hypothetical protein